MRLWSSLEPNIARLIESFPNEFKSTNLPGFRMISASISTSHISTKPQEAY